MSALYIVLFGLLVGAGGSLSARVVYERVRAERRAVAAFREQYRLAVKFLSGDPGYTETDVMYFAIEGLRAQTDIKAGRHRFGVSASALCAREESGAGASVLQA